VDISPKVQRPVIEIGQSLKLLVPEELNQININLPASESYIIQHSSAVLPLVILLQSLDISLLYRMMLRFWLQLLLPFLLTGKVVAQYPVPNAGFEEWTKDGNLEEPKGWVTSNQFAGGPVVKSPDAHSGSYAMRLSTGVYRDSSQTLLDGATAFTAGGSGFGFSFSGRPSKLQGYFKYLPKRDTCRISVLLMRWNPTTKQSEPVGLGAFISGDSIPLYRLFETPITYLSPAAPDTAFLMISPNEATRMHEGTVLLVDDIHFTGAVSASEVLLPTCTSLSPNPCTGFFTYLEWKQKTDMPLDVRLLDTHGRTVKKFPPQTLASRNRIELSLAEVSDGLYIVRCAHRNGKIETHRLVLNK
jgi:hypothetical protein